VRALRLGACVLIQRHDVTDASACQRRYRDYLDSCLLEGEGFHDIAAIMVQHANLVAAKADIAARHASCLTTLQCERSVCLLQTDQLNVQTHGTVPTFRKSGEDLMELRSCTRCREQLDAHVAEKRAHITELRSAVATLTGEAAASKP
jgi:hypothetical protein